MCGERDVDIGREQGAGDVARRGAAAEVGGEREGRGGDGEGVGCRGAVAGYVEGGCWFHWWRVGVCEGRREGEAR